MPKRKFWRLSPEGVVGLATAVSTNGFAAESFAAIALDPGVSFLSVSPDRRPKLPPVGDVGSDDNVGVLKPGRAAHADHSEVRSPCAKGDWERRGRGGRGVPAGRF